MSRHHHYKASVTGFTLIEILVALAIFGLLSIGAYTVLDAGIRSKQQTEQRLDKLALLQRMVQSIEKDLQMLSLRRVRDELGDQIPLFRGESELSGQSAYMEFTRANWRNPAGLPRSNLQHVIYRFEEGKLTRTHGIFLDPTSNSKSIVRHLHDDLKAMSFSFLNQQDQWQDNWAIIDQNKATSLPKAIKLKLELESFGEIIRVIPIDLASKKLNSNTLQNNGNNAANNAANNTANGDAQ